MRPHEPSHRPRIVANLAMSADGKIDSAFREGQGLGSRLDRDRLDELRAEADAIWDALMGFARYGCNRAHAADYAVIVAQTAFLKAYYPVEYMAALLSVERYAEARRLGEAAVRLSKDTTWECVLEDYLAHVEAAAAAEAHDAGVASRALGEARRDLVEEPPHHILVGHHGQGAAPRRQGAGAGERDHALGQRAQLLRLGHRSDDPLVGEERAQLVAEQRLAVGGGAAQLAVLDSVSHRSSRA